MSYRPFCAIVTLLVSMVAPVPASATPVEARFDLRAPESGPFPSDWFTVADGDQKTGRRVNLPLPDCVSFPSDCENFGLLNERDGFSVLPRLALPFSGAIDVTSVNTDTVFLIGLGSSSRAGESDGRRIGLERVVWDMASSTLYAEPAEQLDQDTRHLLVITSGVRDTAGNPVARSDAFDRFHHDLAFGQTKNRAAKEYRKALIDALDVAEAAGIDPATVVAASVFTTMSVTAIIEKVRDQVLAMPPPTADFLLGPAGTDGQRSRTVFPVNQGSTCAGPTPGALCALTFNQQTRTTGLPVPLSLAAQLALLQADSQGIDLPAICTLEKGAVGRVAFGKYQSPNYLVFPDAYVPAFATLTGTPRPQDMRDVYFNLFLPAGTPPPAGWPVVIFGHGASQHKNSVPFNVAATIASHGLATIAISAAAHGFGSASTLTAQLTDGSIVTFPAGGRSIDQDGNGSIGVDEGAVPLAPRSLLRSRDASVQTIADLVQLISAIEAGMDVDGDGVADLDGAHVYAAGNSYGAALGVVLGAIDRRVRAVGVTAPGAGPEFSALSPPARPVLGQILAGRVPSLLNSPGLTSIGGITVGGPFFNENMPSRGDPPLINDVAGAAAIEDVLKRAEWVTQLGGAAAFAPYLRKSPLDGMTAKPVLIQQSRGDQQVVNPAGAAMLRAGNLVDSATLYRHDLFAGKTQFKNPHTFMLVLGTPVMKPIALMAQCQTAVFFASEGAVVIDPDGAGPLFEAPIEVPLAEMDRDLKFVP